MLVLPKWLVESTNLSATAKNKTKTCQHLVGSQVSVLNLFSVRQLQFKLRSRNRPKATKHHSGIQYYAFLSSRELYATSAANYPTLL